MCNSNLFIVCDSLISMDPKVLLALSVVSREELPGFPVGAVVGGSLQGPNAGAGGVGHGHNDVGHLWFIGFSFHNLRALLIQKE